MKASLPSVLIALQLVSACSDLSGVGRPPGFSSAAMGNEHQALHSQPMPLMADPAMMTDRASLWTAGSDALLGDRRAVKRGDIVTVVLDMNDSARLSNTSKRGRDSEQDMGIPQLLGIPQRLDRKLPDGASMAEAVSASSSSTFSGNGSINRSERVAVRVAATVIAEMANGVLAIEGHQEVRINNELREVTVSGYVHPSDISRRNEVSWDRVASARISYGGRGQITDMQQPRYGQQIADLVLPF